jgi:hypothetical protein
MFLRRGHVRRAMRRELSRHVHPSTYTDDNDTDR